MKLFVFLIFLVLGILAMRRARWAYAAFVILGLLYFPASMGFRVEPKPCDLAVDLPLAVHSLSNYGHIVLFFIFFLITTRQFRLSGWASLGWSIGLTMAMGVAVEIAEGLTGAHHCKTGDLIPDFVGALLGLIVVVLGGTIASARLSRRNNDNEQVRGNQTVG
jgi:VanZ family protein